MEINLNNTHWEKVTGFFTELRVDSRWILKKEDDEKSYGSLRIVSHPDLRPGYLRAIFTYVISTRVKSYSEKIKTTEDYLIELGELEAYSIDDDVKTKIDTIEGTNKELSELFGVKIF